MTTGEDQTQTIVRVFHNILKQLGLDIRMQPVRFVGQFRLFVSSCFVAAQRVEEFPVRDGRQPRAGIVRRSFKFPLLYGNDECFL
ncbi:MAG TPA: hypothetical protein VFT48_04515 [Pyrinomonadaceae bacterium]|nr:hypothetical protein [Pyrinomonadaceae bacterium]